MNHQASHLSTFGQLIYSQIQVFQVFYLLRYVSYKAIDSIVTVNWFVVEFFLIVLVNLLHIHYKDKTWKMCERTLTYPTFVHQLDYQGNMLPWWTFLLCFLSFLT